MCPTVDEHLVSFLSSLLSSVHGTPGKRLLRQEIDSLPVIRLASLIVLRN
jgi:hypothetical protein